MGNLGLLDYGARMYDPAIGRWTAQDPLSEKYYSWNQYNYCVNNPVMFVDSDGRDWYSYHETFIDDEKQLNFVTKYAWTTATSQEELDAAGIEGSYLGEVVVEVNGYYKESFGSKGTMMDDDALSASITIYGKNGKDDIQQYVGLSMSSDYSKYAAIDDGEYKMYYQKMSSSIYATDAYTYRISTLQGGLKLPALGGYNKATRKSFIEGVFFHRTNWDGNAKSSSKACIVIDGRQWRRVEKQLGKSKNIFLKIKRN